MPFWINTTLVEWNGCDVQGRTALSALTCAQPWAAAGDTGTACMSVSLCVCVCVCVLRRGIYKLLLGSKIFLHFHALGHSKTSSLPSVFRAAWKNIPILPQKYFYWIPCNVVTYCVSRRDLNPLSKSDCPQQSHLSQNGTIWQRKGITNPFISDYWGCFFASEKNSV